MENDFRDRLGALAHLETIRSARIEPLQLQRKVKPIGQDDTTIKLPKLRPDRIHVITNICVIETPTGKPQVFIGLLSKDEKFYLMSQTVATAEDSVTWAGQCIALEFDEIFAEIQGTTAADTVILTAFGYSMRF